MKHAFIAPKNYLHLIPQESTLHLLLAHLLEDDQYCKFYKQRQEQGDFIIIDNGAFEFKKPLDPKEYIRLVNRSGITPDIVVAPDYPYQDWAITVNESAKFVNEYGNYFDSSVTKVMCVPQSEPGDWKGWLNAYQELAYLPNVTFIGMSILGIPNAFRSITGTEDISFNRTYATAYLQSHELDLEGCKHHYLGCSDPRELLLMQEQGLAYSNDSSTAFWHAINGICFDETPTGLRNGKIKKEVDFDIPYYESHKSLIQFNINWINDLLIAQ